MWLKLICLKRSHASTLSILLLGAQATNVVMPIKLEDQIYWSSKETKEQM